MRLSLRYRNIKDSNLIAVVASVLLGWYIGKSITENYQYAIIFLFLAIIAIGAYITSRANSKYLLELSFMLAPTLFLYITGVSRIGPLPISPIYIFVGLYLVYVLLKADKVLLTFKTTKGSKLFLILYMLWFYAFLMSVIFRGSSLVDWNIFVLPAIFFGIKLFIRNDLDRAIMVLRVFSGIVIASIFWFIIEVINGGPLPIRLAYYAVSLQRKEYSDLLYQFMTSPNGLTLLKHIFGYQVAVAVPISFFLIDICRTKFWKTFWIIGFSASVVACVLSGQRASLISCGCILILYMVRKRQLRKIGFTIVLCFLSLFLSFKFSVSHNVFERLEGREPRLKIVDRLNWQVAGAKVFLENPMGLDFGAKSWDNLAHLHGADFSDFGGKTYGVHNGYLGGPISMGFIYAIFEGVILIMLFKIMKSVFCMEKQKVVGYKYAEMMAFALLSVMIQALFHNASIFTFECNSLVTLYIFLEFYDVITKYATSKRSLKTK